MANATGSTVLKRWIQTYKKDFAKIFSTFCILEEKTKFKNLDKLLPEKRTILCNKYYEMFRISCKLLQEYLIYSGITQPNTLLTLKQAYYSEILTDGQRWINLFFLFKNYDRNRNEETEKDLINYINEEYFMLYKQLDSYIKPEIDDLI